MNGVNDVIISTLGTALYGPTDIDKSPWDTCVMQRIIYILQLMFKKSTAIRVAVSPPHTVQCWQSDTHPSFRICGVGKELGRWVVFASGVSAKAPTGQICSKTFVHDCSLVLSILFVKSCRHWLPPPPLRLKASSSLDWHNFVESFQPCLDLISCY